MWDWRDAWILQAVVTSSRSRRRDINVDIPSREDLERSVKRLPEKRSGD